MLHPDSESSDSSDSDSDGEGETRPAARQPQPAAGLSPASAPTLPQTASPGERQKAGGETGGETGGEIETGLRQDPDLTSPDPRLDRPDSPTNQVRPDMEIFQFRPDQLQRKTAGTSNKEMDGKKFLPQKGSWILYKEKDKDIWFRAQVIKKGVKASNPMPYYNIQPEFDTPKGVNLDNFEWVFDSPEAAKDKNIYNGEARRSPVKGGSPRLKGRKEYSALYNVNYAAWEETDQNNRAERAEAEDQSYVVFIPKEDWDKPFVQEAMEKELANFRSYGAYEEVRDVGQPRMSSGFVVTEKCYGDVIGAKVRLVVHGNQEGFEDRADSPTVSKKSLRVQFSLAAQFKWELVMADITSAFLQSDLLDREVYVQPPKHIKKEGIIWRLRKPMYGLGDASLQWYKTLAAKLIELGCKRLSTDPAMFYWHEEDGKLGGIVSWHVDDKVSCGSANFYEKVLTPLMEAFTFGSTAEGKYRCLGWNVLHRKDDIMVSQEDYITTKVQFLEVETRGRGGQEKLGEADATEVRGAIGKLRWLADQCRPDIAYHLLELSVQAHSPTYETVKLLNKTVAMVKNRPYSIRYSKLTKSQWKLSVFADASLRGLPDKTSSAMGYIICLLYTSPSPRDGLLSRMPSSA